MFGNALRFGGVLVLTVAVPFLTPATSVAAGRVGGGIRLGGLRIAGSAGAYSRPFPGTYGAAYSHPFPGTYGGFYSHPGYYGAALARDYALERAGYGYGLGYGYGYGYGYPYYGSLYSGYYPSYGYYPSSGYSYDPYLATAYVPSDSSMVSNSRTPDLTTRPTRSESIVPNGIPARLTVRVPADAEVFINDQPTTTTGAVRTFLSQPLLPNLTYTYTVQARWQEDGHFVTQTRNVPLSAGAQITASFAVPSDR